MTRYYAANLAYTTLDLPISDVATSFTVTDPLTFPDDAPFIVKCRSEIMLVGAIDKITRTFSSVTRGHEGTTRTSHDADTTISNIITAGYMTAMFDAIEGKLDATGGTMTGDLTISTSTGSTVATILDMDGHTLKDAVISGGSLLDAFDANDQILGKPVIRDYKESVVVINATGSTAPIELDLASGNVFKVTQTGAIAGINILNPSTVGANSLTMDILSNSSTHSLAWMAPYAVITTSNKVSAASADNSFNAASTVFGANVQMGDIVTVTGFTSAGVANNESWRVVSATNTKIVVSDAVATKAAGDSVTITRRQEFFPEATVPDAPVAYIPKVFTMWSYTDPTRWRILEAGEF